jgi:hypothetical protein
LAIDDNQGVKQNAPVKIPFPCKNQARVSAGGAQSMYRELGVPRNSERC